MSKSDWVLFGKMMVLALAGIVVAVVVVKAVGG